jgi:Tfp pilus assembly protein PilF
VNGAIVAFEHSDALQRLRPQDTLTLAQLYITAGAPAVAASRLRRVVAAKADPAVVATARRLLLGLRHPDLERELEEAGKVAVDGDLSRASWADESFGRVLSADPEIWEAHFGRGLLAWHRGDAAGADAAFQRAIEIDPHAAELVAEMGRPRAN